MTYFVCLNLLVLVSWIIYIANSLYQNKKMGEFFPKAKTAALTIPFYFFSMFSIYISMENLIGGFNASTGTNGAFNLSVNNATGIIFLLASIFLFTYLNFFEKSFPSCQTVKEKKRLSGIYNYIRHPSHYVIFFITFGTVLIFESPSFLIFAIVNHYFIYYYYIIEENQIKKTNPDYQKFLDKTNRFLPYFNINK